MQIPACALLIAYCSFGTRAICKSKGMWCWIPSKKSELKNNFYCDKEANKMEYLAKFFCRGDRFFLVNFTPLLPAFRRCKPGEHLPHQELNSTGYLFPIQNSWGDDNEKRYYFLERRIDLFSLFHTWEYWLNSYKRNWCQAFIKANRSFLLTVFLKLIFFDEWYYLFIYFHCTTFTKLG